MCKMCDEYLKPKRPAVQSDKDQEWAKINDKFEQQLRTIRAEWEAKGITGDDARYTGAIKTLTTLLMVDPVVMLGISALLLTRYMAEQELRDAKITEG